MYKTFSESKAFKIFMALILAVILVSPARAEDNSVAKDDSAAKSAGNPVKEIEIMIQKDIHKNRDKIRKLAWGLTSDERKILILKYSKNPFLPEILNIFAGFGLGSWFQGDKFGGVIGTVAGLSFFTSLTGSIVYIVQANSGPLATESYGWIVAAGITGIFYATFEVLRPISFSKLYNQDLIEALMLKENVTFSFFPYINPPEELGRREVDAVSRQGRDPGLTSFGAVGFVTYRF